LEQRVLEDEHAQLLAVVHVPPMPTRLAVPPDQLVSSHNNHLRLRILAAQTEHKLVNENTQQLPQPVLLVYSIHNHYKHLQLCPERKCKIGMGKTYTQFYRKWSEVKNKLY
jgi:hypothetical protein